MELLQLTIPADLFGLHTSKLDINLHGVQSIEPISLDTITLRKAPGAQFLSCFSVTPNIAYLAWIFIAAFPAAESNPLMTEGRYEKAHVIFSVGLAVGYHCASRAKFACAANRATPPASASPLRARNGAAICLLQAGSFVETKKLVLLR